MVTDISSLRSEGGKLVSRVRIIGDKPNLRLLADDLQRIDHFPSHVSVSHEQIPRDPRSLGNAEQAALVIQVITDVGVGLLSAAVYDGMRKAISAARRRGSINVSGLDPDSDDGDEDKLPKP